MPMDKKAFDEMIHSVENNSCGINLDLYYKYIDEVQAARLGLALSKNTTLLKLNLRSNKFGDSGASALAKMLESNKTLQELVLAANLIGDSGAATLAKALESNKTLQELELYGNKIGVSGAAAFATMLESNKTLQILSLGSNKMGDSGVTTIAKALESNKSLQKLDLSENGICHIGIGALAKALESNKVLTELNLSRNGCGESGVMALATMLQSNKNMRKLRLSLNHIGDRGTTILATMLQSNKTLLWLNLDSNKIGVSGAAAFATMLESNKTLQILSLGSNKMGDSGVTTIAKALESNKTLKELHIGANLIGDSGAATLATMLESNQTLQVLSLGSNQIGDSGATILAKTLESHKNFQKLELYGNKIGDSGAAALAKMLKSNKSLQILSLSSNQIGDIGIAVLAKMLESNEMLQILDLATYQIGYSAATALSKMLESNKMIQSLNLSENQIIDQNLMKIIKQSLTRNTALAKSQASSSTEHKRYQEEFVQAKQQTAGAAFTPKLEIKQAVEQVVTVQQGAILYSAGETKRGQETVKLSTSPFSDNKAFAEIILSVENNSCGTNLDLSQKGIDDTQVARLALALKKNTTLQRLYLRRNQIGDGGAFSLALALKSNKTLQTLDLRSNQIGDAGATELVKALETNKILLGLGLSGNPIIKDILKIIEQALIKNRMLPQSQTSAFSDHKTQQEGQAQAQLQTVAVAPIRRLETKRIAEKTVTTQQEVVTVESKRAQETVRLYTSSSLDNKTFDEIISSIENNSCSRTLDFSQKNITDAQVIKLALILTKNTTVHWIGINNNEIGDNGARALAKMLESNRTLQQIGLHGNKIGDGGAAALVKALELNKTLQGLGLNENQINQDMLKIIEQTLIRNRALFQTQTSFSTEYKIHQEVRTQAQQQTADTGSLPKSETKQEVEQMITAQSRSLVYSAGESKRAQETVSTSVSSSSWLDSDAIEALQQQVKSQGELLQGLQNLQPAKELEETLRFHKAELTRVQQSMLHVDHQALLQLQGKANELAFAIKEAESKQQAERERVLIFSQDKLSDFYYVFITQLTDCWIACKTIHSGKVESSEQTSLDTLAKGVDKLGGYIALPGIKLLTDIAGKAISVWSDRDKKQAVNRMANYFAGMDTASPIIEALARQLTFVYANEIQAIKTQVTGRVRKAWQTLKTLKNSITANDIDNAIKEYSVKFAKEFLSAVMQDKLKAHPTLNDLPILLKAITSKNLPSLPAPGVSSQVVTNLGSGIVAPKLASAAMVVSGAGAASVSSARIGTAVPKVTIAGAVVATIPGTATSSPASAFSSPSPSIEDLLKQLKAQEDKQKALENQLKQQAEELAKRQRAEQEREREHTELKKKVEAMGAVSVGGGGSQVQASMLPFSAGASAMADTTLLYQLAGQVSQLEGRQLIVEETLGIQSSVLKGTKPDTDDAVRKQLGLKS